VELQEGPLNGLSGLAQYSAWLPSASQAGPKVSKASWPDKPPPAAPPERQQTSRKVPAQTVNNSAKRGEADGTAEGGAAENE